MIQGIRMRLSHFSLCLLTTAICTHLYADEVIQEPSLAASEETKKQIHN